MSVATVYAKALYQSLKASGGVDFALVDKQFDAFIDLVDSSKDLRMTFEGPLATAKEKAGVIDEIGKKMGFLPIVGQFLKLLARKRRLGAIKEIRDSFLSVRLAAEGGVSGRLVAADSIGDADVETLSAAFTKKLAKKVLFRVSTDPSLLAGMKVTVNGVTYDGTLRSQLQRLRDRFVQGTPS
ncbi:MAG: ATP synthase F1 subunit delta [Bdellovibrionota bacterium]